VQTKQPVAWLANKSQDPNKDRKRHSSVNSKIDSKMTRDMQCEDRITEAKETNPAAGEEARKKAWDNASRNSSN